MNNSPMTFAEANLDRLAASQAQEMVKIAPSAKEAKELDNLVTKTLGVLQENGVYAAVLFLSAQRKAEKKAEKVLDSILNFLDTINHNFKFGWEKKPDADSSEKVLSYISDQVVVNLEQLLLVKESLEQMLIYARYGAKARVAEG